MNSWIVASQAPLSMRFSSEEYWNGLPFPSPGDLPNPGIEPRQILHCWATREDPLSPHTCMVPTTAHTRVSCWKHTQYTQGHTHSWCPLGSTLVGQTEAQRRGGWLLILKLGKEEARIWSRLLCPLLGECVSKHQTFLYHPMSCSSIYPMSCFKSTLH